jgi:ATP/maltotriose-dependent transcriptional regulator MalT/DNA-binding SARP family transcriptional activator
VLSLSGVEVSARDAESMAEQSEGWITGILLLASRLRAQAGATLLGAEKVGANAYQYLAEEVLNRQTPDIQRFLTTSAVLREMSSQLCQDLLNLVRPSPLLEEVERRSLFVTRFGSGASAVFRYHALFREFLQDQLRRRDRERYQQLHLRCAEWFNQSDDVEESVYHYLAAEAFPEATVVMERVAREWFTRGRGETLLGWAEALPTKSRSRAPWVSLYQSRVLTDRNDYDGARQALDLAEEGCAGRGDTPCLSRVYSQRATIAVMQGDYEGAIAGAQAALDMLDPESTLEKTQAQRLIGKALILLGRCDEGIQDLRLALTAFRKAGSPYDVVVALQDLTLGLNSQGRFDEAVVRMNEALAIARRLGAPGQLAGVLNDLATLHSVRGEYQEALALYEEGLATARRGGDPGWQAYILIGMADVNRDIGAYGRAESLYDAASRLAVASEPRVAVYLLTAQADMCRWRHQHERASSLIARARAIAEDKDLGFEIKGLIPLGEGILLSESGDLERGLALLNDCIRYFEEQQANEYLARARFLSAKALLTAGQISLAMDAMRHALALAAEIGTDHFAAVEGQHADALIAECLEQGVEGCEAIAKRISELRSFAATVTQLKGQRSDGEVGRLEIYALGEGRVVRDGHLLSTRDWQAAMSKELFFFILMNGPLERNAIGLEFWPDASRKKMSDSFHSTLYRLRRAIGQGVVVVEDGYYRLGDLNYWFDVDEYEAAIERARLLPPQDLQAARLWDQAVSLYQGDLLSDVDRMWCVPTREKYREMHLEALIGLGRCAEARGDYGQAIDAYERALVVDELREDVCRDIMQCYVRVGMRSKAVERYERCREVIARELGVDVSPETARLAMEIKRGT